MSYLIRNRRSASWTRAPLSCDFKFGSLEGDRLIAVNVGYLHPAVPHLVLHVAAPEDDQARLEFLSLPDERHFCLIGIEVFM